ncbi:MAG TPA: DUF349 domain-containing protein [Cyclobacteriaceae bacterium]|nr:DUF349 domain-containing protein [Cyclobacteriaceae bacterium]
MDMQNEQRKEQKNTDSPGMDENHGGVAVHTEADMADHEESDSHDENFELDHKIEDYSDYSKKQLVDLIKELSKEDNFKKVDAIVKEIRPLFDELKEKERIDALSRFKSSGGVEEDFEYKGDTFDIAFEANLRLIKDRRFQYIRQQEDKKTENLQRKLELLEKLRVLVDSLDTNNQFDTFKELQKEWKAIGPIPGPQAKTIWANYHALVDRFYDNQSIYFELKELDRRRNLESKLELCARAERLTGVEIIKDAIRELNELHHEFKHIGPVPIEDKDAVWNRFKMASDAVYARRDHYLHNLQQELQTNLEKKIQLCEEVEPFVSFQSDRIKEWNQKTKDILDIQKRWETIGGLPRAKAKEVNKKFWSAFKNFFNNKNAFFKKLDEEREQNLKLKYDLVNRAKELRESTDWESTSNELKGLQARWKEVGPVPEKFREKVFQEFKEACDHFFEHRRDQFGRVEQEQENNLAEKMAICQQLEQYAANGTGTVDTLHELQQKYNDIGFVPRKDIASIRNQYTLAVEKFVASLADVSEDDKGRILIENQIDNLRSDPNADKKIFQKEQAIRKKITKVENDIAVWRNNLEFFKHTASAEKYRDEFNDKIKTASDHLHQLKEQLKYLRTVS